jgi:flavin-dependent dehydrogenase
MIKKLAYECDVMIIGERPASCATARACVDGGLKIVLVEKKKSRTTSFPCSDEPATR